MKIASKSKTLSSTVVSNTTPTTAAQSTQGERAAAVISKLSQFDYPVKVNGVEVPKAAATPIEQLKALEVARIGWETTELAASNKRLYSILTKAYSYYLVMKTDADKDVRAARMDAMEKFIAERSYTFMPSTHDMTRVVKCVFGVDRRRVSAYSIALREALRQEISADDLVAFLEENGGVEQIRMGGTKPLSATKRAVCVRSEVTGSNIGTFRFDAALSGANADWTDKQVVIVATYLPTGEFVANAVIKHDGAVNAALAAFYSNQKAQARALAKAEKEAAKEADELEKAQAQAAKKTALSKEQKMDKQKSAVVVSKAASDRKEKNMAHMETLLEETVA